MKQTQRKVLIFSLAYHPFVGGAEVAIKEITERLGNPTQGEQGFCFEMITCNLDGKQKEVEENFNGINRVYRIGNGKLSKYLFPWLAYRKAIELHKKNNYDIVWAMMANQAGWVALKFKNKFPQVKYLLTLQEGDSELDIWLRTWFMRPIYKAIYRKADYIQAISNFLADRAKKMGVKCEVGVVPNGVFVKKSINQEIKKAGAVKIITVSRLVKKNGVRDLIYAIKLLVTDYKLLITLNVVGTGKLEKKLKTLVKKLNLEERVQFLGQVNNEVVYHKLQEASVFVRPSLSEGLGNAFLEAMAVKIPVIATPVGGIPDFLKDGETGWFCEVKNPGSIAEKINYVLDPKNKGEVDRVIENTYKMVIEKYNWNLVAEKMKNIFNGLILK